MLGYVYIMVDISQLNKKTHHLAKTASVDLPRHPDDSNHRNAAAAKSRRIDGATNDTPSREFGSMAQAPLPKRWRGDLDTGP